MRGLTLAEEWMRRWGGSWKGEVGGEDGGETVVGM